MGDLVLAGDQLQLCLARLHGDVEDAVHDGGGRGHRGGDVAGPQVAGQERRGGRSPAPVKVRGSSGVVTCQAPSPETATMSMVPGAASVCTTLVTSTISGPRARAASAAASTSGSVEVASPVSSSSSNWFGVMICAAGTTRSRISSGMPSRT